MYVGKISKIYHLWFETIFVISYVVQVDDGAVWRGVAESTLCNDDVTGIGTSGFLQCASFFSLYAVLRFVAGKLNHNYINEILIEFQLQLISFWEQNEKTEQNGKEITLCEKQPSHHQILFETITFPVRIFYRLASPIFMSHSNLFIACMQEILASDVCGIM